MVKTVFCREADAKLFGSGVSGLANFQSDIDVHLNIPAIETPASLELLEEVAAAIRRINGMNKAHVRRGRVPIVHATFNVRVPHYYTLINDRV